jgi:hypothetical protein
MNDSKLAPGRRLSVVVEVEVEGAHLQVVLIVVVVLVDRCRHFHWVEQQQHQELNGILEGGSMVGGRKMRAMESTVCSTAKARARADRVVFFSVPGPRGEDFHR